jgi:DNA polymerase-1
MKLLIIDSNALLHRSFHALPPLANSKGEQTGAVYGFLLTLFKAINDLKPDFIAATFDTPAPTFRHKKFKEYKAKRPKAPEEFYQQIPKTKEILEAFKVPIFEKEGFEGDDLIATIAKKAPQQQVYPPLEIYILTGDLDTLQLVNQNIKIYTLGKGVKETVIYDKEKILERFGLEPKQMVDFKALAGDPSDNIPGATGIGQKTAAALLKKYDNLENLYQKIEGGDVEDIKPRIKDILLKNKEQVFFSRILAKTREDAPIDFSLKASKFGNFDRKKIEEVLKNFEFYSLLAKIPDIKNKSSKLQAPNSKL